MLIRHFDQVGETWRIKNELRGNIHFRPANLLEDFSALGTFDIILCRNVLIYFDQPTKTRILHAMSRRLAGDGTLLLGGAESVLGLCDAFSGVSGLRGVYGHAGTQPKSTKPTWPAVALPVAS